ncbi:MAG: hypothetical protein ACI4OT_03050 [Bacilli bacterium]
MDFNVYFQKIIKQIEKKLISLDKERLEYSPNETQRLKEEYEYLQNQSITNLIGSNPRYIAEILIKNGEAESECIELIKRSEFINNALNNMDESMKSIFMSTEQYTSTINELEEKFNLALKSIEQKYEFLKSKDLTYYDTKKNILENISQKMNSEGFTDTIDSEEETELFFEIIGKSLSNNEQLNIAYLLLTNNINKYSKRQLQTETENKEVNESVEKSIKQADFSFLGEDEKYIELIQRIVTDYSEEIKLKKDLPFIKTVIDNEKNWLANSNYDRYLEDLELCFLDKKYNVLKDYVTAISDIPETEREEYIELFKNDFKDIKDVLNAFIESHPKYRIEEKTESLQESKKNLIFLTNENYIPYIEKDIEEENKQEKENTIKTLEKIRLGYGGKKNTNWSEKYYSTHKVMLYREFCSSGVIEIAYVPITKNDYLIIGGCDNNRENLSSSQKIDKVITQRLNDPYYKKQFDYYKSLLSSTATRDETIQIHENYLHSIKEKNKIK